jgi:hypothetical protein
LPFLGFFNLFLFYTISLAYPYSLGALYIYYEYGSEHTLLVGSRMIASAKIWQNLIRKKWNSKDITNKRNFLKNKKGSP